jgi:exodeoxyribonuclease VII large subunit
MPRNKTKQESVPLSQIPGEGATFPSGRHIYTVSEITRDIRSILKNTFSEVWVEGEVTGFSAASSGHFYFSLKDEQAIIPAAMFSRANKALPFKLENGLKVLCWGSVDVYGPRGQYQLIAERVEPQGIGARALAFEQLKKKLLAEGLFDSARKRPLPYMPFRVGIVTSATGAAVRDILQILKKGAGCVDAVIRPARVQGEHAAREIAEGIEDLNRYGEVDLIIVSRGGGSTEDLWAFNEEEVARAVAGSRLAVISAVGHQINTTLSDCAADVFVETPSAAAKLIVDRKNRLLSDCDLFTQSLIHEMEQIISGCREDVSALKSMLKSPLDRLQEKAQFLDELHSSLSNAAAQYFSITLERVRSLSHRLEALSPLAVLSRGYSLSVTYPAGEVIKDATALKKGERIKTVVHKGSFIGSVEETSGGS